jgi:putative membrane protein
MKGTRSERLPLILTAAVALVLVWSGIKPRDYYTWILEVFPVLVAVPLLAWLYPRFRFTTLVYVLVALHCAVLMVGGHHTYAQEPIFNWLKETLGLQRNYYDRLGHFMQGFVPAMIAREVLIRKSPLRGSRWLPFLVVCVCLAISAVYEFVEWWTALLSKEAAESFLGTQGDVWDTQWDMFLCTVGAICSLATLSRLQDRQLASLGKRGVP